MNHHLTIRRIVSDIRYKNYLKYPLSTIPPKLTIVRALFRIILALKFCSVKFPIDVGFYEDIGIGIDGPFLHAYMW